MLYLLQVDRKFDIRFFCSSSRTAIEGGGLGVVDVVDGVDAVVFFTLGFGEYLGTFESIYLITFWTLLAPKFEF